MIFYGNKRGLCLNKKIRMEEINIALNQNRRAEGRRLKRHSLKTDMTPMVDLGFLLITFFVFTAALTTPMTINLYMPYDGLSTTVAQSHSITFISSGDNALYYYFGTEEDAIRNQQILPVSFSENSGVGKIIRQKQMELQQSGVDKRQLIVLIKPDNHASYKNVIDLLDEMTINGVTRYALLMPEKSELQFLKKAYLINDSEMK
jgi:biopolymer transport protein ExbD